jgi:hypothetical protein
MSNPEDGEIARGKRREALREKDAKLVHIF